MSTEGIDRRLHRLYDEDLSPEERAALEKEIAASPELGKKLEGLREVGVVLRAARTDEQPIDAEALWSGIAARIASPATSADVPAAKSPAAARPALRAIEGGKPTPAPAEHPATRRRRQIGIFFGALAVAAAALFVVYGTPPSDDATPVASGETPTPPAPTTVDPGPAPAPATDYTEVLAVDFGTNVGTIFAVEGEGGQRYAVVWLDDVVKDETEAPAPTGTPD